MSAKLAILMSAWVVLTAANRFDLNQPHIVGGQKADHGEWPWQLALYDGKFFICGASIVAPTWAVSAAHCINDIPAHEYSILGGTTVNKLSCVDGETCVKRNLIKAIKHQNFSTLTTYDDVAYLEWEKPIKEVHTDKLSVKYAPRATKTDQAGKNCYITGWGKTSGFGPLSVDLLEAKIDVLTHQECKKYHDIVAETQVCILDKKNMTSGACKGDSGGPLVCEVAPKKWELVGATSWGNFFCNVSSPAVYTRISSYNNWLDGHAPKI